MKYFLIFLVLFTILNPALSKSKDSITVYVFLLDECRICQEMVPALQDLHKLTTKSGMSMVGIFPNYVTQQAGMEKFRKKYRIHFPLFLDHEKLWARQFKATILPEVILYNEDTKQIVYRGAINDLFYAPGKRRHRVSNHYVKEAIFALQNGGSPDISETQPIGCFINYSENENQYYEK